MFKSVCTIMTLAGILTYVIGGRAAAQGCSDATLRGQYAFGVTGYTPPGVVAGIKVFDGEGGLTQRDYQGDSLRTTGETELATGETGTYTVDSNCTGTMVINLNAPVPSGSTGVIKILFVISDGGRHIHEVVAEFTPPGSLGPVPTQTSADDWKVWPDRHS
jgi:hypothetical protein